MSAKKNTRKFRPSSSLQEKRHHHIPLHSKPIPMKRLTSLEIKTDRKILTEKHKNFILLIDDIVSIFPMPLQRFKTLVLDDQILLHRAQVVAGWWNSDKRELAMFNMIDAESNPMRFIANLTHEIKHIVSPFDPKAKNSYKSFKDLVAAQETSIEVATRAIQSDAYLSDYHKLISEDYLLQKESDPGYPIEILADEVHAILAEIQFTNPVELIMISDRQLRILGQKGIRTSRTGLSELALQNASRLKGFNNNSPDVQVHLLQNKISQLVQAYTKEPAQYINSRERSSIQGAKRISRAMII